MILLDCGNIIARACVVVTSACPAAIAGPRSVMASRCAAAAQLRPRASKSFHPWTSFSVFLAAAILALLFHMPASEAASYYVSAAGSDANSGTSPKAAFLTIQRAAGLTNPGDIVNVMDGTYGPVYITRGGAPGAYITYRAYPGQHPIVNKTSVTWNAIGLQATAPAPSYIIIDGFNVVGNAQSITADQAQSAVSFNNTTNGNCIGAGALSNHIIIRNNNVSWCPGSGIIASGDYVYIYQNIIHHNSFWSPLDTSGITVSGNNSDSYTGIKVLVYNNILYANQNFICNVYQTTPCRITDGEGIIVDSNVDANFSGRVRLYNNVTYNNGGPGIEVYRSQHVDVIDNTTYMNNVSASAPAPYTAHAAGGEIAISQSNDVVIANNIAYGTAGIPQVYAGITSVTNLYWDYNLLFNGDGAQAIGAHDLIVDPLFVAPAAFNFHLKASSKAIGSGTRAFSVDRDIEGNPRPRGWPSRGAYQY